MTIPIASDLTFRGVPVLWDHSRANLAGHIWFRGAPLYWAQRALRAGWWAEAHG